MILMQNTNIFVGTVQQDVLEMPQIPYASAILIYKWYPLQMVDHAFQVKKCLCLCVIWVSMVTSSSVQKMFKEGHIHKKTRLYLLST